MKKKVIDIIIKIFVVIGALTFIVSGITGSINPLEIFFDQGIFTRVLSVIIGIFLLYNLKNSKKTI